MNYKIHFTSLDNWLSGSSIVSTGVEIPSEIFNDHQTCSVLPSLRDLKKIKTKKFLDVEYI